MITFSVKNQSLILTSKVKVVADSQDYLFAQFSFSEDWAGTLKLAQFTRGEHRFRLALDEHDTVKVPWEILKERGKFSVTVTGNNQEGEPNKVITTNPVSIRIYESGLVDGEVMEESTAGVEGSVLHQILAKTGEAETYAQNASTSESNASNSANSAATSAETATQKATAASTSASEAQQAKTAAQQSATAAAESAQQAAAIATQLSDVLNAPRFYYNAEGHLMFSYGSSGE